MDRLKIVKGNTFETVVEIRAYKYNGEEITDFDLNDCTNIAITNHIFNEKLYRTITRKITKYEILDPKRILIKWDKSTVVGDYSLEMTGKLGDDDWRFFDKKPIFSIVNTNAEANIPQNSIIREDCYQVDKLKLYIICPKGDKGETGNTGPVGPKGDKGDPFTYEDFTQEQLNSLKGELGDPGNDGQDGSDGKSAYELAVENGYEGTLELWLNSLHGLDGNDGSNGKSAYLSYVDITSDDPVLTEEQWIASLHGADGSAFTYSDFTAALLEALRGPLGETGQTGPLGAAFTYADFTPELLAALKGEPGNDGSDGITPLITVNNITGGHNLTINYGVEDQRNQYIEIMDGIDGQDGSDGVNGSNGKSAYEIAVEQGYEGTIELWLLSLHGQNGLNGNAIDANGVSYIDFGLPSGTLWSILFIPGVIDNYNGEICLNGLEVNNLPREKDIVNKFLGGDWTTPTFDLYQELLTYAGTKFTYNTTQTSAYIIGFIIGTKTSQPISISIPQYRYASSNNTTYILHDVGPFYGSSFMTEYLQLGVKDGFIKLAGGSIDGNIVNGRLGVLFLGVINTKQRLSDWNQYDNEEPDYIKNKPLLSVISSTGSYNDLNNKPGIFDNNGHDYVEIGGIKWATKNVGASSISDPGLYFQWGDTLGYTASQVGSGEGQKYFGWADYKYCNGTDSIMTKYNGNDGKTTLDLEDDAARANMGGTWRLPTQEEFSKLKEETIFVDKFGKKIDPMSSPKITLNGVTGLYLQDKSDPTKKLFFPLSGNANEGTIYSSNRFGSYASNTVHVYGSNNYNRFSEVSLSDKILTNNYLLRSYGISVRGVLDELNTFSDVAFTGDYNDLINKPTIPTALIQADWNQTDNTALDYIKNKPTIPSSSGTQIQADWNQSDDSLADYIKNKPTITNGTNGTNGITPSIDSTSKHWMIGSTDTGIVAEGQDGITPHIDSTTGNWFIGSTDTGVHAQGPAGSEGSGSGVLSDWNETDNTSLAYIANKPTIPSTTGMVTSTTITNIEVVSTLPAQPDANTIYIVQ